MGESTNNAATYVNYIAEINAFHELAAARGFSAQLRSLWFAFMDIGNTAHWPYWIQTSTSRLMERSGLSRASVFRFRKEMVNNCLLIMRGRGAGQSCEYHLLLKNEWGNSCLPVSQRDGTSITERLDPSHRETTNSCLPVSQRDGTSITERLDPSHRETIYKHKHKHNNITPYTYNNKAGANENSGIPSLDDEISEICSNVGWNDDIRGKLTEWAEMCSNLGKPRRGPILENDIKNLLSIAGTDTVLLKAVISKSISNGWIHFYHPDRKAGKQEHKMTREERAKAYEEQAKRGGWS